MWSDLIVVLIFIFLVTNHVGHSFLCLYSFLGKVHSSLCPFFNWVFFFLLSCKNSLNNLGTKPLSGTWFANIFSFSVGCLFTFLMMSFEAQVLNFVVVQFIYFFFCCSCFCVKSNNSLPNSEVINILCFLLIIL